MNIMIIIIAFNHFKSPAEQRSFPNLSLMAVTVQCSAMSYQQMIPLSIFCLLFSYSAIHSAPNKQLFTLLSCLLALCPAHFHFCCLITSWNCEPRLLLFFSKHLRVGVPLVCSGLHRVREKLNRGNKKRIKDEQG